MFEQIFQTRRLVERHQQAPLRSEREQYLRHLLEQGFCQSKVHGAATYMLHIIRVLGLNELRVIDEQEIEKGAKFWAEYRGPFRDSRHHDSGSPKSFAIVARGWFRFLGRLAPSPRSRSQEQVEMFSHSLRFQLGLAAPTIRGYSNRASIFLRWLGARGRGLETLSPSDIDDFLRAKRAEGWRPRGIATQCMALRSFFRFAEAQRWCSPDLSLAIRGPRISKYEARPMGPTWAQVRELLKLTEGMKPEQLRAKALLLLFTVYGLRGREVMDLQLEDFDWRSEVFTVRRGKRGGIQQFPIQYEIGEAILKYLRYGRPHVDDRHVFLGERRPWGPLLHSTVWRTVSTRMRELGIELDHLGPHSLRHACATRLLQKGTSLKDIADFLGHRNTKSVSIYAKHDNRALRKVAAFRLAGLR
ncbi:integrase [Acidobacteria bacterium AB60]|nr:integrase [Acidobacteria bacterium AB60]